MTKFEKLLKDVVVELNGSKVINVFAETYPTEDPEVYCIEVEGVECDALVGIVKNEFNTAMDKLEVMRSNFPKKDEEMIIRIIECTIPQIVGCYNYRQVV